jgi:hypothetical protein
MTDNELKDLVASLAVQSKEANRLIMKLSEEMCKREEEEEARKREEEEYRKKEEARRREEEEKAEARRKEEEEARKKEREEFLKKQDAAIAELWTILRENEKQIGTMSDNDGMHAEQYFQYILNNKLEFGGMKYDKLIANLECSNKKRELVMEFDIVLVNCQSIAVIEVKNNIRSDFIWKLVNDRLPVFRRFFPEYNDRKAYLGIAGFSFSKKVLEQADKYGIGIIRQVGDSVEVKTDNLKAY